MANDSKAVASNRPAVSFSAGLNSGCGDHFLYLEDFFKRVITASSRNKRVLRTRMESIKRKIHETKDAADIIGLMQSLNISTIGCDTVKQMKEMILDHLLSRKDNHLASNEVR